MTVEVVVPFRGGCPHRERACAYVRERLPWPVVEAPGPDPWCKAAAVMPAVEASTADVIVVHDADVLSDGLGEAVAAVEAGAAWALPHERVHRLTEQSTAAVLAGADPADQETEERPYYGIEGGGIVVATRETLLDVPMDPRFVGWGGEDMAWGMALTYLAGDRWRGRAPLYHLWHPHPQRLDRKRGSIDGHARYRRYVKARRDPAEMRRLVEEGRRDALAAHHESLHPQASYHG